jgi:hypothetical protein
MIKTIILLIFIYLFNIIDYCQTVYAINLFGLGVELNPIARFFFEHDCEVLSKLVFVPVVLVIMGIIIHFDKRQR